MAAPSVPDRQKSFIAGELDPSLHSSFEIEAYAKGVRKARNWIVSRYGRLLNRPGTYRVAAARYGDRKAIIRAFDFSDDQAYAMEIGDQYLRLFDPDGAPVEFAIDQVTLVGTDQWRSNDGGGTWATGLVAGLTHPYAAVASKPDGSMSVAVGDGWIAVTANGGATWTEYAKAGTWLAVAWTGTFWVISGPADGSVSHTLDPTGAWSNTIVSNHSWDKLAVNGATVVVMGRSGDTIYKAVSVNHGAVFAAQVGIVTDAFLFAGWDVGFTGARWLFLTVEKSSKGYINTIKLRKTAGVDPTTALSEVMSVGSSVAYGAMGAAPDGRAVVFTHVGAQYTTDHGDSWSPGTGVGMPSKIFYMGDLLVGVSYNLIATSQDDGKTWAQRYGPNGESISGTPNGALKALSTTTEIALPYEETDLPKLRKIQSGDVLTVTHPRHAPKEIVRSGSVGGLRFSIANLIPRTPPVRVANISLVSGERAGDADHPLKEWAWVVAWAAIDGAESLPSDVFIPPEANGVTTIALSIDRPARLQWDAVPGADLYYVYRGRNGLFGFVGTVKSSGGAVEEFRDDGDIPVINDQPRKWENPFASEPPGAAVYHEDRLAFGNLRTGPATIRWSESGDYDNFDEYLIKTDDDSFKRTLTTRRYEEIRALVLLGELLVFTSEAEWALSGSQGPISFRNLNAVPQTYHGSAWIEPLTVGKEVLFVQSSGNEIRNFFRDSDGYDSDEITALVGHLFQNRKVVDWAYAHRPHKILYVVFEDGGMVALTYDKKAGVAAFSPHDTYAGIDKFESVAIVPKDGIDVPWFIVQRGEERSIERMAPRHALASAADFCGVDSAVEYFTAPPSPINSVPGLDHLEGRQVYGLGDGTVYGPVVVQNGQAVFSGYAVKWIVGLGITCEFESLDSSYAITKQKSVERVHIETSLADLGVDENAKIYVGPDLDSLVGQKLSTHDDGRLEVIPESNMNPGARVAMRLEVPVPIEIRALTRMIAAGG